MSWIQKIKYLLLLLLLLLSQPGSPFREPLFKFLVRYPVQSVDFMMNDTNIRDMQYLRYFVVS